MNYRFVISGGGTGGHIYPAIAIANELKKRFPNAEFLFIGAIGKMEMQKVPQAGYLIEGLPISGIQRRLTLQNFLVPFRVISSLCKARKILKKFRPDVVIGTGGYASAPTLKMAQWLKIPYVIQEQNSLAGITNRWVCKDAQHICVAYENMERFFPKERISITGNPVREDLLNLKQKTENDFTNFGLNPQKKTLLILGGSLGARAINQLIEKNLDFFQRNEIQLLWQCGSFYFEQYKKYDSPQVRVVPFIKEMNTAYTLADFIISRAGASSISELCIVGKPVVFIPSPNVSENHQYKNAKAIVDKNAAILITENQLDSFPIVFEELLKSPEKQQIFSQNIRRLALPNATSEIVNKIMACIK